MGNCCTTIPNGSFRNRSNSRHKRLEAMNTPQTTHEGIKIVETQKLCDFPTSSSLISICILTWNMNGKVSREDLKELVGETWKFDVFVVGLQEAAPGNMGQLLQDAVADRHRLAGASLMKSLQIFFFAPWKSEPFTKEIRVDKQAVGGFGGLIGRKKGAVALSVSFKGVRMAFICCHLSAHTRNVEERNFQFRQISRCLEKKRNPYSKPYHITVWLGDLNYRIQGITTRQARSLIQEDHLRLLSSKDQLLQEAQRGQVFNGYYEGALAFKPTYKYNIGSNDYDTSYKVRVPSWTDRILYKVSESEDAESTLHSYQSIDSIKSSDHKPVKAHICFKLVQKPQFNFTTT